MLYMTFADNKGKGNCMDSLRRDGSFHPKKIEATPEYMRKLFIMPDSSDRFVEFGEHLLDMIHDFFQDKGGIHSAVSLTDLAKIFDNIDMPKNPMLIRDVLDEIKGSLIKHSVKVANPYYVGHMTSAIPYFMILLEMIAVSLNQNQVKIESAKASSFVEREFLCWMHRLVYHNTSQFYKKNIQNQRIALGNITSDGTVANMTALALAMAKAFPPDGKFFTGVRQEGLPRALEHYGYRQAVVLVSRRGHYSICKAGTVLGIGAKSVVFVPVQPYTNMIDIDKLWHTIDRIRKEDLRIGKPTRFMAVVGVAGTTETGNIDDLVALAEVARSLKAHYHIDAAWGGGALLMDGGRELLRGIDRGDSVSMDAHKLLYSPNSMGMCLFKNIEDSRLLYHTSNYIIRKGSVDQGRFTLEGSRPFASLKPWAALKIIGRQGYEIIFNHAKELQETFVRLIRENPEFELLNTPQLFIINYRFVPVELGVKLDRLMEHPRENADKITMLNNVLNELNVELHRKIRERDTSFVSRTRLESTRYAPRKIVVLRAITVNPNTEQYMLAQILDEHRTLGEHLWQSKNLLHKTLHIYKRLMHVI